MKNIFQKVRSTLSHRTTYTMGLLQTRAYRILNKYTAQALVDSGISPVDWALLGVLFDKNDGLALGVLAETLGVEAPFVTQMLTKLKKTGFVKIVANTVDSRSKSVLLSDSGKIFVHTTEQLLRDHMRPLLKGVSIRDVLGYVAVLEAIVEHDIRSQNYKIK